MSIKCPVCFTSEGCICLIPCGHILCVDCITRVHQCPTCRKTVESYCRIYPNVDSATPESGPSSSGEGHAIVVESVELENEHLRNRIEELQTDFALQTDNINILLENLHVSSTHSAVDYDSLRLKQSVDSIIENNGFIVGYDLDPKVIQLYVKSFVNNNPYNTVRAAILSKNDNDFDVVMTRIPNLYAYEQMDVVTRFGTNHMCTTVIDQIPAEDLVKTFVNVSVTECDTPDTRTRKDWILKKLLDKKPNPQELILKCVEHNSPINCEFVLQNVDFSVDDLTLAISVASISDNPVAQAIFQSKLDECY